MRNIFAMRIILSLFCILFFACGTPEPKEQKVSSEEIPTKSGTVKLEQKQFFEGRLEMLFPNDFEIMDHDVMLAKYHKNNLPTFVYTNDDNTVNCVINFTENPSSLDKLNDYESIFGRRLGNNGVTVYRSQIAPINNRDFLILEFEVPSAGFEELIYNHMVVGVLDGRLFMATFNCMESQKENWQAIGNKIINSIQFPKEA